MLKDLTIKNYALIKHLELSPSQQLNVVTGETGAGKSIMVMFQLIIIIMMTNMHRM